MALLVRTWNLFHGNAVPPARRAFLQEMVELVSADDPDVVCLQEVPVWASIYLERWSGMRAFYAEGAKPLVLHAGLGRLLTEAHHGVLRSAFTGEGLATLVARRHATADVTRLPVGPRRVLLGVQLEDGPFVGNFHVTGGEVAAAQFRTVLGLVPGGAAILAGDVNLRPPYDSPGWSDPLAASIDQILVRGLTSSGIAAWPVERRRVDGRLLSDHAPVEMMAG